MGQFKMDFGAGLSDGLGGEGEVEREESETIPMSSGRGEGGNCI